ncbi:urea transporter [Riemerella columbina]|uniref:urea transporter n=1 Tax=Riemerella columbina TaxID=103810 RepID=UPI0026703AEF|nr:urea transporter [Riemerella columbina]WKS95098.1 urea transporter [Riemerella columbina]
MKSLAKQAPFVDKILKGMRQIILQENSLTGLLFIIGIFLGSWEMGIAAILATASGTLTAQFLKYDEEEIKQGLYGFSAALVGVALTFLFEATPLIWALVIIGGALAAVIQHFFFVKKIPVFTLPFILITWGLMFVLHKFTHIAPSQALSAAPPITDLDDFATSTNGFGEVIFQGGFISGVLFFIAVFINNPAAALYGLFASLLGASLSHHYGEPSETVHLGFFSFNVVLSAIVFAGWKKMDGLWVLVAVVSTWVLNIAFVETHILDDFGGVFTFPFVAGTWVTLLLKNLIPTKKQES